MQFWLIAGRVWSSNYWVALHTGSYINQCESKTATLLLPVTSPKLLADFQTSFIGKFVIKSSSKRPHHNSNVTPHHRRQSVYNILRSTEIARPKSEAGRAEICGILGRGCSPPHDVPSPPAREPVKRLSSSSGVMGEVPSTWQFRTFYRLTKPLLVSILLIPNLFQWIFAGSKPQNRRPQTPQPNFCESSDTRTLTESAPMFHPVIVNCDPWPWP